MICMRRTVIASIVVFVLIAAALLFVLRGGSEHGHSTVGAGAGIQATANSNSVGHHGLPTPSSSASESSVHDLYAQQRDQLLAIQRERGSAVALEDLEIRSRKSSELGGVCHAIAHDLGHEALLLAGGKVGAALTVRNDVCGGGFTHGVIEDSLSSSKDPARDLLRICAPRQEGSCFHGVGHGVMFATGLDVAKSLDLCDLAPSRILSVRCGEGVFMQLFSADVAGGHAAGKGASPESVETARTTCAGTRMPYAGSCWFYSPTLWLADRPDDFEGAMDWCSGAPTGFGRQLCAKGVGSRTIKYHPDDPRIGARICGAAGELEDSCLVGMGSYWSVHHKGAVPARDVCSRLGSARLERRCLRVT